MTRTNYFKRLFQAGAIWNLAVGIEMLVLQKFIFEFLGMAPLAHPIFYQFFCVAVLLFGIGYWLVSRDLTRNHDIVRLGVAGKVLVFVFTLYYAATGSFPWLWVIGGIGDLVFAVLFIHFLIAFKPSEEEYRYVNV